MQVFSFYHPKIPTGLIDVFVDEPIAYQKLEEERVLIKAGTLRIPVVSRKHLIELKQTSG